MVHAVKFALVSFLPAASAIAGIVARTAGGIAVQANTTYGTVEGRYDRHTNVNRFFGIPFAKPPVGELRWQHAQPPDPWTDVKLTIDTKHCAQINNGILVGSEDCLYLDIVTPSAGTPGAPAVAHANTYPVQFWIYGGGMAVESFPLYQYNDAMFADNDLPYLTGSGKIVTVFTRYRVDFLGFMSHPALAVTSETSTYGNYALSDLYTSLTYCRDNIANFGGNPTQITIQGESAGATLVGTILGSSRFSGLFRGAIAQSIWNINGGVIFSQSARNAMASTLVGGLGCGAYDSNTLSTTTDTAALTSIATCLRSKSALEVLTALFVGANFTEFNIAQGFTAEQPVFQLVLGEGFQIYPVVDGPGGFLPVNPITAWNSNVNNHVNVIMGENADEMSFFVGEVSPAQKLDDFGMLYSIVQLDESATLQQWFNLWLSTPIDPADNFFDGIIEEYQKYIVTVSAGMFSANIGMLQDVLKMQAGRVPGSIYRYVYAQFITAEADLEPYMGVAHTFDLNYVWGYYTFGRNVLLDTFEYQQVVTYTEAELQMGATIHKYWSNFIVTGSPNAVSDGLAEWKPVTTTEQHTLVIKAEIPGGAASDPCVMFTACLPEPTAGWRANAQAFFQGYYQDTSLTPDTCSEPVVGFSHSPTYSFASNCTIGISPFPGALPCCMYQSRRRSLLFGGATAGTCRDCM